MSPYADVLKWEHLPFPKSLPSFQKLFPDDTACAAYLERIRWEKGFVCPKCGEKREPYRFAARPGVLRCKSCRNDIALTAGTGLAIMGDNRIGMRTSITERAGS